MVYEKLKMIISEQFDIDEKMILLWRLHLKMILVQIHWI